MQITRCNTLAELNELASDLLLNDFKQNPHSLICAATGNSPTGIYQRLAEKQYSVVVENLTFVKLDEWYGLPMDHPASCEYYLDKYLLKPLSVSRDRYTAFDSKAADPEAECARINQFLEARDPIDICILGIGQNGHIAFNEPADALQPHAHLASLSTTSLKHTMIKDSRIDIKFGFTLGMADILRSKKIILPVFGRNKSEIMQRFFEGNISTYLPASFLWLHPDVTVFYCETDN